MPAAGENGQKKAREPVGCGLESNFLRRRLEETGATIAIRQCRVCFIVAIADIHLSNNSRQAGISALFTPRQAWLASMSPAWAD
jgi:hypothetical protein